jgi:hypothetical protein
VSDWLDVKSDKQQQKKEKILAGWRRQVCQYHIGGISEAKADTVQIDVHDDQFIFQLAKRLSLICDLHIAIRPSTLHTSTLTANWRSREKLGQKETTGTV